MKILIALAWLVIVLATCSACTYLPPAAPASVADQELRRQILNDTRAEIRRERNRQRAIRCGMGGSCL